MSKLSPVLFLRCVVRPALVAMGWPYHTVAAEQLLVGTAAQESGGFLYLRQNSAGPALGVFQMEPDTFYDLWSRRPAFLKEVLADCAGEFSPAPDLVAWNHRFGAMMARLKYRDDDSALPAPGDIRGMAWTWKRGYNSMRGAGRVEEFELSWRRYVAQHQEEMWPDD